jgi:uncharacterized protein YndB with AHSA1/START domain
MKGEVPATLAAHVSMTIDAPRSTVWDALVDPEKIKQYIPVSDVVSDWLEGSPILWSSVWEGKSFELRGKVLRREAEQLLEYERSRPIFRASKAAETPVSYHRVTIELSDEGTKTLLSVTEDGSTTERERAHSEGGWRLALGNLKALLEGTSMVPLQT